MKIVKKKKLENQQKNLTKTICQICGDLLQENNKLSARANLGQARISITCA
jgi:RNase P subunit RPR2